MSIDCQSLLELEKQARKESCCGGEELWCEAPQLEQQDPHSLRWAEEALAQSRRLLFEESFCHKHRINEKAFTRQRHFTFANSMLFLMQKTLRAIQTHTHSFFEALVFRCTNIAEVGMQMLHDWLTGVVKSSGASVRGELEWIEDGKGGGVRIHEGVFKEDQLGYGSCNANNLSDLTDPQPVCRAGVSQASQGAGKLP